MLHTVYLHSNVQKAFNTIRVTSFDMSKIRVLLDVVTTKRKLITVLLYILFCFFLAVVTLIIFSNTVTQKPGHTTYSPSTLSPVNESVIPIDDLVTPEEGIALYRVKNNNGDTCTLLKADGLVEIYFISRIGEELYDTYLPEKPVLEGNCQYDDRTTMTLTWSVYVLFWEFAKTLDGKRWYVKKIELTFSTDSPAYYNIKAHGSHFKLVNDQMLFSTPVDKSFTCDEYIVYLISKDPKGEALGLGGRLALRVFQLQPFRYKGFGFGPSLECGALHETGNKATYAGIDKLVTVICLGWVLRFN